MLNIQVLEDKDLGYGVDARLLHKALGSKKHFTDWIESKIKTARATKNIDYQIFSPISEKMGKGRPSKEYIVSLRIAKKIAMLEATDKGDKVRDYFIECEEKLYSKKIDKALPQNYIEALEALVKSEKEKAKIEHKNSIIEHSDNTYTASELAKDLGMSALRLNQILFEHKVQYKKGRRWYPYAGYESWYSIKEVINDETNKSYVTTRFTLKGKLGVEKIISNVSSKRKRRA